MKKMLTSVWMTVLLSAVIYLGATYMFWKVPTQVAARSEDDSSPLPMIAPSWDFVNPEADQMMAELKEAKKEIEKKNQQLVELQQRLESERNELTVVTQAVHQMQVDFDKGVVRVKDEETANLKRLSKIYVTMSPESAGTLIAELEDPAIVKLMAFMKDGEIAAILESMSKKGPAEEKRASNLLERLRLISYRKTDGKK